VALTLVGCGSTRSEGPADAEAISEGSDTLDAGAPDAGKRDAPKDSSDASSCPEIGCPPYGPSFARDVMPILQRRCNDWTCHADTLATDPTPRPPLLGPPALDLRTGSAVTATRAELDAAYVQMSGVSITRPDMIRVVAGYPELSMLLAVAEGTLCASPACNWPHTVGATNPMAPASDELMVLHDWIVAGAYNDSWTVPPPSTSPLLRVPLRVHAGRSGLDLSDVVEAIRLLDEQMLTFGICFDAEIVESEQPWGDAVQLTVLAYDEEAWGDPRYVVRSSTPSGMASAVERLFGAPSDHAPSDRELVTLRERLGANARQDDSARGCEPPRVLEDQTCGGETCAPLDIGIADSELPPCCADAGACGVEPLRVESLLPRWSSGASCVTAERLLAPSTLSSSAVSDPACPALRASIPLLGEIDLEGCCRPGFGACGVSSETLPRALWEPPSCLDGAQLDELLSGIAPGLGAQVQATACSASP